LLVTFSPSFNVFFTSSLLSCENLKNGVNGFFDLAFLSVDVVVFFVGYVPSLALLFL